MSEEEKKSTVRESVLESIKAQRVSMHSKKYFALWTALFAIGTVLIFCALLYLASFVVFELAETGVIFIPSFGLDGWFVFFRSLPWILILLTLVFALILELMVRHYSFAYRRPLMYSMLGIIALVLLGGFLISRAHFHRQIWRFGQVNQVPMVPGFYRRFGTPRINDVHKGVVREVSSSSFIIENRDGSTSTVFVTPATRVFQGQGFFASDTVVIFGNEDDRVIQAVGIRSFRQ